MSSRTILLILRNNVYLRLKISNAILALLLLIMSNRPHVQCEVEEKTKHMHKERTKYSVWQLMHIDKQLLPFSNSSSDLPCVIFNSFSGDFYFPLCIFGGNNGTLLGGGGARTHDELDSVGLLLYPVNLSIVSFCHRALQCAAASP